MGGARLTVAEFIFGMAGCCAVVLPFFALVGWLFGCRDEALELCVLGAVALVLAAVRRWWRGR